MAIRHKGLLFKKSMVWEKEIQLFVSARLNGFSLNVPSGSSMLGTIRVDMDPAMNPDRVADMNDLPFENGVFDSAVQDPPWKLNYYARMRPFFELIRVVKVNGLIIYNAPWIPTSKAVELQATWIRRSAQFGNVSIISVFKKTTDKYDVEQAIRALDPLPALEEAPGDGLPRIPGQCRDPLVVVM